MHKIFTSFHHAGVAHKSSLIDHNRLFPAFIDGSVDTDDIDGVISDDQIRKRIRVEYLRDTAVTILFVGLEKKGGNMSIEESTPACTTAGSVSIQDLLPFFFQAQIPGITDCGS